MRQSDKPERMLQMKVKTALLVVLCIVFMSSAALAESVHFTASSINSVNFADKMYEDYGLYVTYDGSNGMGFGNRYLYKGADKWDDSNLFFSLNPNTSATLHFDGFSAEGVVFSSLIFESGMGIIDFTHSGGAVSSITIDQVYQPGSDLMALFGNLIDYSLGGITAITYTPAAGSYPNNLLKIYEMGYSPYATPIPGAVWLMGTGLAGLAAFRSKKSR